MVCVILASLSSEASASHFRGGDINYQQSGGATAARFETTVSFRCTFFFGSCPAVGTTGLFLGSTGYGDGAFSPDGFTVLASNDAEDNFTARETHTHTYADGTRSFATHENCCTLSSLLNNSDANWRLFADVNLTQDPNSPKTSVPPVVTVGSSGSQTFLVPASDPGGQTLRWRLATNAEAGGYAVNPSDYTINPNTGQVTFITTGKPAGLYHSSIVVEALTSGNVVSATLVTFLVRIGQGTNNQPPVYDTPPTPADGTAYTVAPGDNLAISLQASDPDAGDTVEIVPGPLPTGATFNPTDGNPATGAFSFTPTAAQDGQDFVVNFTAQDGNGGAVLRSFTIKVRAPVVTVPQGKMNGKGSLTTAGVKTIYAFILDCAADTANFAGKIGSQAFKSSAGSAGNTIVCSDDPGVPTPSLGFDTATGTVVGTYAGQPATIEFKMVDGGADANDTAQLTVRNGGGTVVFTGSGAPPGQYPGARQPTGFNVVY